MTDHRKSVLKLLESEPEQSEKLVQSIDQTLSKGKKMSKSDFDVVFTEVMQAFAKLNEVESELHDLSNLALLDKDSNSALGNSIFDIKRSKMIEYDKEHRYILPATRNVFLKYYSTQPAHLDYWTEQDRVDYLAHVTDGVAKYVSHGKGQVQK
jgi:hypothetical protein